VLSGMTSMASAAAGGGGGGGGGGGSSWTSLADIDLSDGDITDVTLTLGAGDTNIRNSADDATRVVGGYADTVGTSTGSCVASTANAGVELSNSASGTEATSYLKLDAATYGQDFSALKKDCMVSVRVRSAAIGTSNDDTVGIWLSSGSNQRTAALAFGVQQYRSGGQYHFRAMRLEGGSFFIGSAIRSDAAVVTDYVVTFVVKRGRICDAYVTLGTGIPTAIPTPGASVLVDEQGTSLVAIGADPAGLSDAYVVHQAYSGGGAVSAIVDVADMRELEG